MNTDLTTEIKKLKISAIYGKKRHFNASDRKRNLHHVLVYSALIMSIITGSVLFGVLKDIIWEHLPATFALISAILLGTEEFFKFGAHASEHQAIGSRYLGLSRECVNLALAQASNLSDAEVKQKFDELQKSLTELDTSAGVYPTNKKDYEKSRQGVAEGEEKYTSHELNDLE